MIWSTLWFNMNLANVSDANGGLLSVVKLLEVACCEKRCMNLCVMVCAVFVEILKVKGYLLNVSVTNKYFLFFGSEKIGSKVLPRGRGERL